jgi:hypothetical protein
MYWIVPGIIVLLAALGIIDESSAETLLVSIALVSIGLVGLLKLLAKEKE